MKNKIKSANCLFTSEKNDIEKNVEEVIDKLNLDAPYSDVDPQAADIPAAVADEL